MDTGKIIKNLRKSRGISAEQLADILGVAPSTVYRYENGDIEKMPYKILIPIAKALGTDPLYLLGIEEEKVTKEDVLLDYFRLMDDEKKDALLNIAKAMVR